MIEATRLTSMHGKNVEFGNLIPGKYVLLEGNLCYFEWKYFSFWATLFLHKLIYSFEQRGT